MDGFVWYGLVLHVIRWHFMAVHHFEWYWMVLYFIQ